jgi:endonuclease/exonuclease/phosphatase family metal-dependent hydrolase
MTYNVHGCRGADGRLRPQRILEVIAEALPDVVALQELDADASGEPGLDQAVFFARELNMELHFAAARAKGGGHYGNALLTQHPSQVKRSAILPRLHARCEARAAQWVRIDTPAGAVDVVNTHLGLLRHERLLQIEALLGKHWLQAPELLTHFVLCGDLNALPGSLVHRRLCARLRDSQSGLRLPRPTFPALFPLVRIDHVFVSRALQVRAVRVPASAMARLASDHRPLVVDLEPASEAA